MTISGVTVVAGVVGAPVAHSLSPLIHNAWIEAAAIDAIYVAFAPPVDGFEAFARGLRGGAIRGLNVTVPFKETALALADVASEQAIAAGAANVLVFERDGTIRADNTDGMGLLYALDVQSGGFDPRAGPAVILGAGGAARGAAAALVKAGAPEVRLVNRTVQRADTLAEALGQPVRVSPFAPETFADAALIVNATTQGLGGGSGPPVPFEAVSPTTVVMEMVYRPLQTQFACRAVEAGLVTVDGLAMLIGQAIPSFEAFYGVAPPSINVRGLCLTALGVTA